MSSGLKSTRLFSSSVPRLNIADYFTKSLLNTDFSFKINLYNYIFFQNVREKKDYYKKIIVKV